VPGQPYPWGHPPTQGPGGWPAQPGTWPPPGPGGWRPPAPVSPGGQPLASFGDRFLAYLIDAAVLGGVMMAIYVPAFLIFFLAVVPGVGTDATGQVADQDAKMLVVSMLSLYVGLFVFTLALYYLYLVEYQRRTGQTLGKRVMKLRVVPLDPTRTYDRAMAFRRFLVQIVAGSVVPGLSYVDGLWQLWDKPYQQCLHDKWAQTVVIKVPA
jgi:uncharacterized RDD family membrane protein YckC